MVLLSKSSAVLVLTTKSSVTYFFVFALLLIRCRHIVPVVGMPLDWTQTGSDINGAYDFFGSAVAMSADGKMIVVGAPLHGDRGANFGRVRVYQRNSSNDYSQIGSDLIGEAADDQLGHEVVMSADGKIIGVVAIFTSGSKPTAGRVRVYQLNASNEYSQIGSSIDGEFAFDLFGQALAMSADGNRIAVSAPQSKGNGLTSGRVRVYELHSSNEYLQIGSDIIGEASYDLFGTSMCMSEDGKVIAVGAIFNDGAGAESGHVRVYQLNSLNEYSQIGTDIDGEAADDRFGSSVTMSADGARIAIGAIHNDGAGSESGHVQVYQLNSLNEYSQIGSNVNGKSAGDRFGFSIAMSADGARIAVGAIFNDGAGSESGHVRVYQLNSLNEYSQIGTDINGTSAGDMFGFSVAMSTDGARIVVGSPFAGSQGAGLVRVFTYPTPTTQLTNAPTKSPSSPVAVPILVPMKPPSPHGIVPRPITLAPILVPVVLVVPIPIIQPTCGQPLPSPHTVPVPIEAPSKAPDAQLPPTTCGLFGLNFFCPQPGKCGFFRRLFKINGCQQFKANHLLNGKQKRCV